MEVNNHNCEVCNQCFASSKALSIHSTKKHNLNRILECPDCKRQFDKSFNLKRHVDTCINKTKFVKEAAKQEIIELKTEILKQEVEHQKEINQLLRKTIDLAFINKMEENKTNDHKFVKLHSLLENSLINKPHEILLQNSTGIAQWFFRTLEKYGMSKVNYEDAQLIILFNDDIKPIIVDRTELFKILRCALKNMKICFDSIVSICLGSTILPLIQKQILSVNEAQENYKHLKAWIKEENTENFEKPFYHFFNILVESELRK